MTLTQNERLPQARAFAIGHSHLTAFQLGYEDAIGAGETCGIRCTFAQLRHEKFKPEVVEGGLGPAVAEAVNSASWDVVVSLVGGNLYSWLGFVEHPVRKLDFVSPDAPDAPIAEGAEIVPASAIRQRMLAESEEKFALLSALRAATTAPMYHLESPPPIPSETHIRTYPGHFRKQLEARPLAPALIRWKLWRLQSRVFREFCDSTGIEFVEAPSDMTDENGMLAEAAWPLEPTHANRVYGKRQVRQVEELLAGVAK